MLDGQRAKYSHRFQTEFFIGDFKTGRAGHGLFVKRLHGEHGFDRAAGGERVAEKSFHRRNGRHSCAEKFFQRPRFHRVVVRRGGAVGADEINFARLKLAAFEGALHRGERATALGLRRGGVEGVAARAPAGEPRENFCTASQRGLFGFNDEHRRAFAEADAGAPRIERAAAVWVEQQQRAKTVQREPRQRIAGSGEHYVRFALLN